ncbi:fibronectin type III domain-containing protein, partial [Desulfosporosinus sp. I2]|uniref:fibronectin type III domain-containing protein n=1 Tax=Desulfosporosinus sp. I2 TaxID=1617025 RepID=UPI0005EFA42D
MKKYNFKLITLVLCLLISTLIFPKNTLALSTPLAPTNLTATVSSTNQINLTWNPASYATGYYVYRSTSPTGTYSIIATPQTTSYIDSSLSLNTTYYYKVRAINSVGTSSESSAVFGTTNSNGTLSVPTSLTATVANANQ